MSSKRAYAIELEGGSGSHYNYSDMHLTKKEVKFLKKFQKVFNRDTNHYAQGQDDNGSIRISFYKLPHERSALK